MKWVGQSITDFIARFRSDVYLESISSGTIASGGNLGLDSNNKIVKATAFDGDITGVTAGTNLTGGGTSGTVTLNLADASDSVKGAASFSSNNFSVHSGAVSLATAQTWTDPVITSDNFHFTSANANDPLVIIKNTADDANSGRLRFLNQRGADGQDDDETGIIEFFSYDDGTPSGERYARIIGTIDDATSGQESGKLSLQVASHDGGDEDGLVLTGGSVDAEVDVTIGNGAASVTTIAGNLVVTGSALGVSNRVYGDTIKILPSDFLPNEDAGVTKTMTFDDTPVSGLKAGAATMELVAFVDIPEGKKATHLDIYDESHNLGIEAFEMDIHQSGMTSKGSGNANTQLDITDVNATETNYLAIVVTTTATSQRVHGGLLTIADQ
jgi:hypothetical protein|tara:strand:+ start:318 stop:1469 length:1152 start_codon:yes stop_codon:yes gene_type:complete